VGTMVGVLIFYRKKIISLFKKPYDDIIKLIIATIPVVIAILLFRESFEKMFGGDYLPFAFLITAIVLTSTELLARKSSTINRQNITKGTALYMGLAQVVAVIPGISRSGMTISAGLLDCCDREKVADFSFLMSIPIIGGSMLVTLMEGAAFDVGAIPSVFGVITAAVSSFFAIKLMKIILKKIKLYWFSIYLVAMAVVCFIVF
ncbi:MAG: undecaprenyl-diphosphate phosphatase, partial [Clostridia bacterium]